MHSPKWHARYLQAKPSKTALTAIISKNISPKKKTDP